MIGNSIFHIIEIALFCTIIIELIFGLMLGIREKDDLLTILLVNILTNPLLVSITYLIGLYCGMQKIVTYILEVLVIIIEGFIYKKLLYYKKRNPFIISLILNIMSYSIGLVINNILY